MPVDALPRPIFPKFLSAMRYALCTLRLVSVRRIPQLLPALSPKVNFVSEITFLFRDLSRKLNRLQGAHLHAGLFPFYPALLTPERRIGTKITLEGLFLVSVPQCQAGFKRTCLNACLTADAFFHINDPDVPILFVHKECLLRTGFNTGRLNTLPVLRHSEVIGKFSK
jgi:hypothetical protein